MDNDIDDSSDRHSQLEHEEAAIYNEMHLEAEEVTSGYSTISSSKEEEYLSCHLANQNAAVIAASKVALENQGNIPGLISSHGQRRGDGADTMAANKESIKTKSRSNNQEGGGASNSVKKAQLN